MDNIELIEQLTALANLLTEAQELRNNGNTLARELEYAARQKVAQMLSLALSEFDDIPF